MDDAEPAADLEAIRSALADQAGAQADADAEACLAAMRLHMCHLGADRHGPLCRFCPAAVNA